jgi:hypothetical protein
MARPKPSFARPHSRVDMRIFHGKSGVPYLVFRTPQENEGGSAYHIFGELEGMDAARDCGAKPKKGENTRTVWKALWKGEP